MKLAVFSHFPPQIPPTRGEPKTLLRAPNECALLRRHFHRATKLIPQHFCWDRGQQTRSPQCEHKAIDTVHREPDNPTFHLHSRLSSITGILSLVSSLVARRTNRSLGYPPLSAPPPFQPPLPEHTPHRCLHKCGRNQASTSDLAQVDVTVHEHRSQKGELAKWYPGDHFHDPNQTLQA